MDKQENGWTSSRVIITSPAVELQINPLQPHNSVFSTIRPTPKQPTIMTQHNHPNLFTETTQGCYIVTVDIDMFIPVFHIFVGP